MVAENIAQMSALLMMFWFFGLLVGLFYISFVMWGLYKLSRAKKPLLFVLGFFINPIAFISAFFKLRRKK